MHTPEREQLAGWTTELDPSIVWKNHLIGRELVKTRYAIAAGALLLSAAAGAKDRDTARVNADADAKTEKKICQSEHVTGSLARTQTICMTAAEWNQLRQTTRHDMDDIQRNAGALAAQGNGANGGPSGLAR